MSQGFQASRRKCNGKLVNQRDTNRQVLELADKKVAASKREAEAIVADILFEKKRVIIAERQYCHAKRKESTPNLNEKLFKERSLHGESMPKFKDGHAEKLIKERSLHGESMSKC